MNSNYTHNIPTDPLGWTWNIKLTPLPIFLANKIKNILRKTDSSKTKLESAEKLAQVKTILTWWTKTISPKFGEFCATFRISWKWVETTKTSCFTPLAGGISSHLMPFTPPKWPQITIFGHLHLTCSYENCVNPTLLPSIVSGEYIPQLYGLCTHVHRDSSWFWDVIICRKPKKRHFFHFWWSPGGAIIILQPHKLAFCATGTMAHQNLKRKWGGHHACLWAAEARTCKMGEKSDFRPHPPCSYYVFLHHFPLFVIFVLLLFQLIHLRRKCNTVI